MMKYDVRVHVIKVREGQSRNVYFHFTFKYSSIVQNLLTPNQYLKVSKKGFFSFFVVNVIVFKSISILLIYLTPEQSMFPMESGALFFSKVTKQSSRDSLQKIFNLYFFFYANLFDYLLCFCFRVTTMWPVYILIFNSTLKVKTQTLVTRI